jgi:hypothetical protein
MEKLQVRELNKHKNQVGILSVRRLHGGALEL